MKKILIVNSSLLLAITLTVTWTCQGAHPVNWRLTDPVSFGSTGKIDPHALLPLGTMADLSIIQTGPTSPINAGDTFTFTLTITNNSMTNTAQGVLFTDILPQSVQYVSAQQVSGPLASILVCPNGATTTNQVCGSIPTLMPQAQAVFTITAMVASSTLNNTQLTNTALVTSSTAQPDPSNTSSSLPLIVNSQAGFTLTAEAPDVVNAGQTVINTVMLTNSGPSDALNTILTVTIPVGTSLISETQISGPTFSCMPENVDTLTFECLAPSLPAGNSATFTFSFMVNNTVPSGVSLTTTINASADNSLLTSATVTTTVINSPDTTPVPLSNDD